MFYFDNISFLAHAFNHLFLPDESSINQASYHIMVSNCSRKKKTIYGGSVVEKKNEMHGDEPVSDMRHALRSKKISNDQELIQ